MSTISATAGTLLSKHHAASAKAAAHQTTSFSQPAKPAATARGASPATKRVRNPRRKDSGVVLIIFERRR
jgi:hypothetical protein